MIPWYVFVFASAIFISIVNILNKKVLLHEHALEFTASRSLFVAILSLILIPFINLNIPWYVFVFIYFVSLLLSVAIIPFMKSVRHGEISEVAPLMNISPLFLVIIAFLVLGEVPTIKQYFGIALLVIGAYSLEAGIANKGFFEPIRIFLKSKIIHLLMFSLLIWSLTATLDKLIITRYTNAFTYIFLLFIFKAINLIALESYRHGFSEIVKDIKKDFKLLLTDSIFVLLANVSYVIAVAFPNALITLIIPIKRTSTLFTTILGGKIFREKNLLVKVLACVIMIWGAVFILI